MPILPRKQTWRLLIAGVVILFVIVLCRISEIPYYETDFVIKSVSPRKDTGKCSIKANLVNRKQDDPVVLECISKKLLVWPDLKKPYNLSSNYIGSKWDKMAGQWRIILKLLNNKRNGIFVEAGANNGEFISTTLRLEQQYNWTGILVEPDPAAFAELKTKRRKAWLSNVCLSPSDKVQQLTFTQHKKVSTWSKLASAVGVDRANWKSSDIIKIEVPCVPFYSLVASLGLSEIDYFSLDVEGAEMEVLKSIPFDKVLIRTLTVEYDKLNSTEVDEMHKFMSQKGFQYYSDFKSGIAADFVYVHNSVVSKV